MPVPQRKRTHGMPTKSETTVIVHGIGNAFWHRLFVILYMTLRNKATSVLRPGGGATHKHSRPVARGTRTRDARLAGAT